MLWWWISVFSVDFIVVMLMVLYNCRFMWIVYVVLFVFSWFSVYSCCWVNDSGIGLE